MINKIKKYKYLFLLIILFSVPVFVSASGLIYNGFSNTSGIGSGSGQEPVTSTAATNSAPTVTYACNSTVIDIGDVICRVAYLIKSIIPVLISIAMLVFIWGVVTYVMTKDDEDKSKARNKIMYGIIGLAVIVGMWGLVAMVTRTFGISTVGVNISNLTSFTNTVGTTESTVCSQLLNYQGVTIASLFDFGSCFIRNSIIPLLFGIATMIFIYGVVQYIYGAEEEEKREKGRSFMIWGLVALAVMISIWGLVKILGGTFGIESVTPTIK